jgi:RNA polymerase sigma-70 factor (ECF subfamily)
MTEQRVTDSASEPPGSTSDRASGVEQDNAVAIDGLQEASDGALVLAIARYHEEALAEAYRRNGGAVFALARRLLADQALAEEVVQEVFLRLWTQPDRFDPERGSLRSFLLAQSHGRAVDMLRSETSRRRREEREARETAEGGYDIEREVLDLAIGDHVKEVLDRLPEEERRAIELAYFAGLTYRQVAARLDQPEGTVKSRIRSGLRRMRADLVDAGIGGVWSES